MAVDLFYKKKAKAFTCLSKALCQSPEYNIKGPRATVFEVGGGAGGVPPFPSPQGMLRWGDTSSDICDSQQQALDSGFE